MSERRQRIEAAYEAIRAAEGVIATVRASCQHELYRVGWYSWRSGNYCPQRLCKECDAVLGDPPPNEERELGPLFTSTPAARSASGSAERKETF